MYIFARISLHGRGYGYPEPVLNMKVSDNLELTRDMKFYFSQGVFPQHASFGLDSCDHVFQCHRPEYHDSRVNTASGIES
jgi:hypothetical protein